MYRLSRSKPTIVSATILTGCTSMPFPVNRSERRCGMGFRLPAILGTASFPILSQARTRRRL